MMTNGDPEGRIFYPTLTRIMNSFLARHWLYLLIYLFIYLFQNKLVEVPEYSKMQFHTTTLLDVLGKIAWVR